MVKGVAFVRRGDLGAFAVFDAIAFAIGFGVHADVGIVRGPLGTTFLDLGVRIGGRER